MIGIICSDLELNLSGDLDGIIQFSELGNLSNTLSFDSTSPKPSLSHKSSLTLPIGLDVYAHRQLLIYRIQKIWYILTVRTFSLEEKC